MLKKIILVSSLVAFSLWSDSLLHVLHEMLDDGHSGPPSVSRGTSSHGELIRGRRLPTRGKNYETYSPLGSVIGRTHLHSTIRSTVLAAYDDLLQTHPDHRFVFAETGWAEGGDFAPHRTHQNGMSIDFVVPVRDDSGDPSTLECSLLNMWCYGIDFDSRGTREGAKIDFETIAAHLLALDRAARSLDAHMTRVILAPDLRDELFATSKGREVRRRIRFMQGKAWVRHDDHYHVDFALKR